MGLWTTHSDENHSFARDWVAHTPRFFAVCARNHRRHGPPRRVEVRGFPLGRGKAADPKIAGPRYRAIFITMGGPQAHVRLGMPSVGLYLLSELATQDTMRNDVNNRASQTVVYQGAASAVPLGGYQMTAALAADQGLTPYLSLALSSGTAEAVP